MEYTHKSWANGEVITAAALNNIEDGVKRANDAVDGMVANGVSSNSLNINNKITGTNDGILTVDKKLIVGNNDSSSTTVVSLKGILETNSEIILPSTQSDNANSATSKSYVDNEINNKIANALNDYQVKSISVGQTGGISTSTTDKVVTLTLATASDKQLGGIKVGKNLTIDNGVLSGGYSAAEPYMDENNPGADGLMTASDKAKLTSIAAGATANIGTVTGIRINSDRAYAPEASGQVNIQGIVTGIKVSNNTILSPNPEATGEDIGVVDISSHFSTKANIASPTFTGTATFEKIKIGNYELDETKLSQLLDLINNGGE